MAFGRSFANSTGYEYSSLQSGIKGSTNIDVERARDESHGILQNSCIKFTTFRSDLKKQLTAEPSCIVMSGISIREKSDEQSTSTFLARNCEPC